MFPVLGLLVFPSRFPQVVVPALLVAGFLMLAARPLAVFTALFGSRFSLGGTGSRRLDGLRGAVPIVLATVPLMAGYAGSSSIFHMVFFTVLARCCSRERHSCLRRACWEWTNPCPPGQKSSGIRADASECRETCVSSRFCQTWLRREKAYAELELAPDVLILPDSGAMKVSSFPWAYPHSVPRYPHVIGRARGASVA
jgi:hypothetical protein